MAPSATIPGLGPGDLAPLLNAQWTPVGVDLTPEHYFVLTRVDGKTPLRQIILIAGFSEQKTVEILRKLKDCGAIYFPGETPAASAPPPAAPAPPPKPKTVPPRPGTLPPRAGTLPPKGAVPDTIPPIDLGPPPPIDENALAEPCDLTVDQKRAILVKQARLKGGTLFDVLEVAPDCDKRTLKRAYFRISKDFHPDRYYGKNLGSFRERLDRIFAVATKAFEHLDDDSRRAGYVAQLASGGPAAMDAAGKPATVPPQRQSPAQKAAELFDLACQHQVLGDLPQALKEFAAAIRMDPAPRYLRRAAEAALRAQELRSAEEYATKAVGIDPRDAGTHRMLAKVYRAMGRVAEALAELERASRLDPENRYIAAELDELKARG